jgi:hypothetical protein
MERWYYLLIRTPATNDWRLEIDQGGEPMQVTESEVRELAVYNGASNVMAFKPDARVNLQELFPVVNKTPMFKEGPKTGTGQTEENDG